MPIRGRFYFTKTDNGNLIGEFSHNQCATIFTETAQLIDSTGTPGEYPGTYHSAWLDDDGGNNTAAILAELTITPTGPNDPRFDLNWRVIAPERQELYTGQAMLANGMLIGDYESA